MNLINNRELEDNKDSIVEDLSKFAEIIEQYESIFSIAGTNTLHSLAEKCKSSSDNNCWSYSIENLIIIAIIEDSGTIYPSNCSKYREFRINLDIKGKYSKFNYFQNPLIDYCLNIEIESEDKSDCGIKCYTAWHFDKHKDEELTNFIHPEYHLQQGGNRMKEKIAKGINYGDSLMLSSPRLSYPPLDAVLVIDYILRQYLGTKMCKDIFDNPEYESIVKNSQFRLWRPYALSFASHWIEFEEEDSIQGEYSCKNIHPNLIK